MYFKWSCTLFHKWEELVNKSGAIFQKVGGVGEKVGWLGCWSWVNYKLLEDVSVSRSSRHGRWNLKITSSLKIKNINVVI